MAFNINKSFDSFLERAISKFGSKYYYDRHSFTKMKEPLDIYCPIHGKFSRIPSSFLKGKGCPYCTIERIADEQRTSKEEFIIKAQQVHGNYYDYSKVNYKTAKLPIEIICPHHGSFWQTPSKHTTYACGCSQCASYGINYTLPAVLYYLQYTVNNTIYYKIGITNKTVTERFLKKELNNMTIIFEVSYPTAKEAIEVEKTIKHKFKQYQYQGPKLLHRGSTELFVENILKLPNNADLTIINEALNKLKD